MVWAWVLALAKKPRSQETTSFPFEQLSSQFQVQDTFTIVLSMENRNASYKGTQNSFRALRYLYVVISDDLLFAQLPKLTSR